MSDGEAYWACAAMIGWWLAVLFYVEARMFESMYDDTTRLLGWKRRK